MYVNLTHDYYAAVLKEKTYLLSITTFESFRLSWTKEHKNFFAATRSRFIKTVTCLLPFHSWYVILLPVAISAMYFFLGSGRGQVSCSASTPCYMKSWATSPPRWPSYTVRRAKVASLTSMNTVEGVLYIIFFLIWQAGWISCYFIPFPIYSMNSTIEDLDLDKYQYFSKITKCETFFLVSYH